MIAPTVQMDVEQLIDGVISALDPHRQRQLLVEYVPFLDPGSQDALAAGLKRYADQWMRADPGRCFQLAERLSDLAEISGNVLYRALGLLAKANAFSLGLGDYRRGVACYNEAAEIYAAQGHMVEQAQSQIGKIYAMANLGQYEEALADGEWARNVLRTHEQWFLLAKLKVNMAIIHGRLGQDGESLALFDLAREAYAQLGEEGELPCLRVEANRAVVLRNLGRFDESIRSSEMVLAQFRLRGLEIDAASAQQILALTYFVLGRYNESLSLLDEARQVFLNAGMARNAMLVELFISDCLLQLRRFSDVLEKCAQVRQLFSELGTQFEVGQAILNEATAFAGLGRYEDALASLSEARKLFEQEGNRVAVAGADLQIALIQLGQARVEESLALSLACSQIYESFNLPLWQARAYLVAGRAALALGDLAYARQLALLADEIGAQHNLPDVTYPSQHLLAQISVQEGHGAQGLEAYEHAIGDLELLCGRLMVEFRADFVADKARLYEDAVALSLDLGQPQRGLEYAERAKSRALLDLLAHRLDLSITARSPGDQPLVDELRQLRVERDHLYRRLESGDGFGQRGESGAFLLDERNISAQKVLVLEKKITDLWHKLLVRNADYARDAALWQVRTEPVQPFLDPDDLLVEYFFIHGRLVVFLVSAQMIKAVHLTAELEQIQRLLQLLWLNLKAVPGSSPERMPAMTKNVQGILGKLYNLLLEPLHAAFPAITSAHKLIIVPHGPLHYLPFAALYDGQNYLLERYEIGILPGASLLRYCRERKSSQEGMLALGNSYQGRLPYTLREAREIAELWSGELMLEEQATLAQIRQSAAHSKILHLATHADFRPDNPLFSGLALADGWLTTLDIFNLRLDASLVTLSACQTGRSVIGGGDELLGLMRSFLAAGAASLVTTLWAVEDQSTANLMRSFYLALKQGASKGAALRQAQVQMLDSQDFDGLYRHPYYWGPFFLVGDSGHL